MTLGARGTYGLPTLLRCSQCPLPPLFLGFCWFWCWLRHVPYPTPSRNRSSISTFKSGLGIVRTHRRTTTQSVSPAQGIRFRATRTHDGEILRLSSAGSDDGISTCDSAHMLMRRIHQAPTRIYGPWRISNYSSYSSRYPTNSESIWVTIQLKDKITFQIIHWFKVHVQQNYPNET